MAAHGGAGARDRRRLRVAHAAPARVRDEVHQRRHAQDDRAEGPRVPPAPRRRRLPAGAADARHGDGPAVDRHEAAAPARDHHDRDRRLALDGVDRRRADPDQSRANGRQGVREDASAVLQPRPGLVRQDRERAGLADEGPGRDHAGDRRSAAGRGDRDRRGRLHLPRRDPVRARRRSRRTAARPRRAALRRLPHGRAPDRRGGHRGGGGQRAGLHDRVRHRQRHRRHRRRDPAGAGRPPVARATRRDHPRPLLRSRVVAAAQAGLPGHGIVDRIQDPARKRSLSGTSGSRCSSRSPPAA